MSDIESSADIVVITIIPKLERQAILKEFSSKWPAANKRDLPGSTTLLEINTSKNWRPRIAVRAIYEAGNLACAIETTNMLSRFNPRFAFLCGIAGNMNHDKRQLGDVVVSGSYAYKSFTRMSSGKKLESTMPNGPVISRKMFDRASDYFASNFIDFSGSDVRQFLGDCSLPRESESEVGKIFCWDLVLDCDETRRELVASDREYRAVEMEMYGFLRALQAFSDLRRHPIDGLVFRGLSDPASGKSNSDHGKTNWRGYAARNAARCLASFINDLSEDDCMDLNF
ncbi:phosphorylase family protein [Methylobacterium organophilum]|uniref:Nucleoside phosphorylase domain-containing protein n=1 Tax=Methylobacterium organophilum TaxID=410 RepID=A0ABQ4T7J8_METOR|nr:hypothetical protein [Methylobacterium organophilum]GJE26424.1 hypothetical protein LKMONMHP_1275 [Methylobacterium organophilum]